MTDEHRASAVRQYVVFHLKLMEVLHLTLLSIHLSDTGAVPENVMGHGTDRFKETLLGATITAFVAITDKPKSTHAQTIWKAIYPKHAKAIDRIWARSIAKGEAVMKNYRDQAGAHADKPHKYFAGRVGLHQQQDDVLKALWAFYSLSSALLKRQSKEAPTLSAEVEGVLLDVELRLGPEVTLNRRWLREMHLIESGRYTKSFG